MEQCVIRWWSRCGNGDIAFRHHIKLQLSSQQLRKEPRHLSYYRCPQVQIGFILHYRKNAYEVLVNTIASPMLRSLQELRKSSLIVVHNTRQRGVIMYNMFPRSKDCRTCERMRMQELTNTACMRKNSKQGEGCVSLKKRWTWGDAR